MFYSKPYIDFSSTAEAMKALSGKGVVHRDLKPQNILLSHSGMSNPPPHHITLKIGKNISSSIQLYSVFPN